MQRVSAESEDDLCFEADISGRYLLARCEGRISPDLYLQLLEKAVEACIGAGKRGLLVDIRNCYGTVPSTALRHSIGVAIAELQSARSPLIVICVLGKEPFIDPGRFAELVAVQHNAIFRAFTDEGNAHAWLESQVAMRESSEPPPQV